MTNNKSSRLCLVMDCNLSSICYCSNDTESALLKPCCSIFQQELMSACSETKGITSMIFDLSVVSQQMCVAANNAAAGACWHQNLHMACGGFMSGVQLQGMMPAMICI